MSETKERLETALARLEISTRKIIATRGYNRDAKGLKALEETIKEQLTHAHPARTTRPVR